MLRTVMARVRALWRRDAITDEISDEMQFHLDQRADALEHQGKRKNYDEALKQVLRQVKNLNIFGEYKKGKIEYK
jgi:hypothetical protein